MTKLYEEALKLSINANLSNIRTILEWSEEATELKEKIQHTEQALRLLQEAVDNLHELQKA